MPLLQSPIFCVMSWGKFIRNKLSLVSVAIHPSLSLETHSPSLSLKADTYAMFGRHHTNGKYNFALGPQLVAPTYGMFVGVMMIVAKVFIIGQYLTQYVEI